MQDNELKKKMSGIKSQIVENSTVKNKARRLIADLLAAKGELDNEPIRVWDVVEVYNHIPGCLYEVGFFAGAEDSSRGDVVKVLGFVAAAGLVVLDCPQGFGVLPGVVADEVFEDVFR